jgi:uridine phosphorylase
MDTLQPHIRLSRELGIQYALLPGDPARVDRVLTHLEQPRELAYNREFKSACGLYRGLPVLVLSTGIGGASMAIAVEELHQIGVTAAIRIGSSGALQHGIGLGELILASGAVRDDGASKAYVPPSFPAVAHPGLLSACIQAAQAQGAASHVGLVRSHDSFYTDQEEEICRFWSARGILGADMETAALYTVAALRGVRAASILNNVVLYQGDASDGIGQYVDGETQCAQGETAEILTALEALLRLEAGT